MRNEVDPIERTGEVRKLIVSTFLTLDGVMQAPGGPGEDDSCGFALGGWSVNYWDAQMAQVMGEAMSKPFDLVLGRRTYDIFAAYWPHATDLAGAKPLNDATKYVASRARTARGRAWWVRTAFGPVAARRRAASAEVSPSGVLERLSRTAPTSTEAASAAESVPGASVDGWTW